MKHLIKNNQIIQSGIPSHFTRENGQLFVGGYENMIDIHYEDGWRDEIIPTYDPVTQFLGEKYYDIINDVVTYEVLSSEINLVELKNNIMEELDRLREEIAFLILQIRLLHDPEPEELTALTPQIRGLYAFAKDEINALTVENVRQYVLRGPIVQGLLDSLKSLI